MCDVRMMPDSFPPPWSVEELDGCMIVWDRNGQAITYVYFEDDPRKRSLAKLLTRDDARQIAANIAKLPMVPSHIMKEIPRQRHSAKD
jgi:hypothetical protein